MITLIRAFGLACAVVFVLFVCVITGSYAPWYFAWILGTLMIVLMAVGAAVLFDTQHEANENGEVGEI